MAHTIIQQPLNADVQVQSQGCPCGISGRPSGTGTSLSPSTLSTHVHTDPTMLHTSIHISPVNNLATGSYQIKPQTAVQLKYLHHQYTMIKYR
jgi:hypothetical protein